MRCGRGSCALLIYLVHSATVPPAREWGTQPRLENVDPFVLAHETSRKDQYVRVVVLACELGNFGRPRHRRPHPRMSISRVRHPQTSTTQQHSTIGVVVLHLIRDSMGEVRVVGGGGTMGAEVERRISQGPEFLDQPNLELKPGVIGPYGDDF